MKPLVLCLVCHTAFAVSSPAEDPVSLGLRGAFSALSPIPDATSYTVRSTAAELLSRYVKTRNGSFFCEVKTGHTPRWSEMKSLQLARVSGTAVSQADQANGIAERYFVSVDCEMFRNYDGKAAKWSQWYNGRSVFMPPAIQVIRDPAGNWSASSSMLASLTPFSSKGDLAAIPHGPKPDSRPAMISAAALTAGWRPRPSRQSTAFFAPRDAACGSRNANHPVPMSLKPFWESAFSSPFARF